MLKYISFKIIQKFELQRIKLRQTFVDKCVFFNALEHFPYLEFNDQFYINSILLDSDHPLSWIQDFQSRNPEVYLGN